MPLSQLWPMLAGIALTPLGIIPAILLLFSPAPRANGSAFALGWLAGVGAGFLAGMAASDWLAARQPGAWVDWLRLLLGLALLLIAQRQWRSTDAAEPGWMRALAEATPKSAIRLGLMLTLANPKVLLLALAAGIATAAYAQAARPLPAALLFALAASFVVALPLGLYLLLGQRILGPLATARDVLARHNGRIMALVLVAFGVLLVMKGLEALAG